MLESQKLSRFDDLELNAVWADEADYIESREAGPGAAFHRRCSTFIKAYINLAGGDTAKAKAAAIFNKGFVAGVKKGQKMERNKIIQKLKKGD